MRALTISFAVGLMVAGCSANNPPPGSDAYKDGELGNGGFLFKCDDSVACDRWSTNDAKDFPAEIATGAVFDVRFVATGDQGITFGNSRERYPGVKPQPVPPYVSMTGDGRIATLKPGFGVIAARNGSGAIVDYVTIRIVKPDALRVYVAEYKGTTPPAVEALELRGGDGRKTYRTVAERGGSTIAGALSVAWTSSAPEVVQVASDSSGVASVTPKQKGRATLRVEGAALVKEISVEVKE